MESDLTKYTTLSDSPSSGDLFPIFDVSDTDRGPGGTLKNITRSTLFEQVTSQELATLDRSVWFGFHEDFLSFSNGDLFTDTSGDTGAAVASTDAAGGVVTLTTGGTDNNECYLHTTKEIFKFAEGKTLIFETRLQYTEANTDDANVIAGVIDSVGANSLVDDGDGPKASYSGAVFFKVDGGANWNVETSISTTQNTTLLDAEGSADGVAKTAGGSYYQTLRIEVETTSSTAATARFYIDNVLVKSQSFTYTSATEMMAVVGVKAGGSNSEVVRVDYVQAWQKR